MTINWWAAALALSMAAGCGVPVSVIAAEPTDDFPITWAQEAAQAAPAAPAVAEDRPPQLPPELRARAGVREHPHSVALIIGIEHYRRDLPEATGAAQDARAFADVVEQTLGLPRANVHLLIDADATKSSLDAELDEWLPRNVSPQGDVIVYFAGHGAPDAKAGTSYLLPWDGDPKFITSQGLALSALYAKLSALKSRRVLTFLDACFTGAGGRSVLPEGARPLVRERAAPPIKSTKLAVFTATGPNEITGMGSTGSGLFSYYLIRGLNGDADANRDGAVTFGELVSYSSKQVANEARRENRDQTPRVLGAAKALSGLVLSDFGRGK